MPTLLFEHTEQFAAWAAKRIPQMRGNPSFGPCKAVGIASGPLAIDQLYGVVVFHDYQPSCRTVQVSHAARTPKWLTKGVIRALLYIPFMQWNCYKIWGAIPHGNTHAIHFNRRLGLKIDGTLRHQFGPGNHAVIVSMTKPEYLRSPWRPLDIPKTAPGVSEAVQEAA